MNEKPKGHGKFEVAEELLSAPKTLEELTEFRELMLEHLHRFEANPEFADGPVTEGFRLLIAATEARMRFKEFLKAHEEQQK